MAEYILSLVILSIISCFFVFGKGLFKHSNLLWIGIYLVLLCSVLMLAFYTEGQKPTTQAYAKEQAVMPLVEKYLNRSVPNDVLVKDLEKVEPVDFVMGLQRYLQKHPLDSEAWMTLGNALKSADNDKLSLMAYQRAYRVDPDNLDFAFAYINARLSFDAKNSISELDKEVIRILEGILEKQPDHENALMMLGVAAYQGHDFALAVDSWSHLLDLFMKRDKQVPEKVINALKDSIAKAQENEKQSRIASSDAAQKSFVINISVDLDTEFKSKIVSRLKQGDDCVLFVYLKPKVSQGRAMPLAALRYQVGNSDFPINLELTDKNSLSGTDIHAYEQLELSARISFSGQALPQKGDWESEKQTILPSHIDDKVKLLIDKVL